MKILVTGGLGFIGSHLVRYLARSRHKVRILDSKLLNIEDHPILKGVSNRSIEVICNDIRNIDVCMQACEGIDVIFHAAAIASIPFAMQNPLLASEVNVDGTENVLRAAVKKDVKKVIFQSTGKVYGNPTTRITKETGELKPLTIYSKSKVCAEEICREFSEKYKFPIVSLRYFSVYGPGMPLSYGFIGDVIASAFNGGTPKLKMCDGMTRDFTFISDVVQANILSMQHLTTGYEVFNIASGRSCLIEDLIRKVEAISGKDLSPIYHPIKDDMVIRTQVDITKARNELSYVPHIDLKEGLNKTIGWLSKQNVINYNYQER